MFDLEPSITRWREQMLAAGITAAAIDELEGHLREEIAHQIAGGKDEASAFHLAVQKIGQPAPLTAEFKNAHSCVGSWGETRAVATQRLLGFCWLVYCAGGLLLLGWSLWSHPRLPEPPFAFPLGKIGYLIFALLVEGIYLRGTIASVLVLKGVTREQRTLWFIALLEVTGALAIGILKTWHFSLATTAFTILALLTLWLFRPNSSPRPATS